MSRVDALADAWVRHSAPLVAAGELAASHCILATRTLVDVVGRLGWDMDMVVDAAPCSVLAANVPALQLVAAGTPVPEWPPEAWSVGVAPDARATAPGEGYNGHLVALVHTAQGTWLVDASAGQLHRPQRHLHVPPAVVLQVPRDWVRLRVPVEYRLAAGGSVVYRPAPQLGLGYRNAPDWRSNYREHSRALLVDMAELYGRALRL